MKQILAIAAVLISLLLGLYFLTNQPSHELITIQPSPSPVAIQSPEIVVETFYSSYLNCFNRHFENLNGKSPRENCPFDQYQVLDMNLVDKLNNYIGGDPILCAQDLPTSISVDPGSIQGNTATTIVHESGFNKDNPVTVDLTLENNQWKITNIICQPPSF